MDTPTLEPEKIIAGDSLTWTKSLDNFLASAGWILSYALRGPAAIDFDAVADGDAYRVEVTSAVTALWAPGFYSWIAFVTKAGDRYTLDQGSVEILPDPVETTTISDQRPHCKRMLDAIEALFEGKATKDQIEYEIDGIRIKRMDVDALLRWRQTYKQEWAAWQRDQKIKKGGARGNRVLVRFPA